MGGYAAKAHSGIWKIPSPLLPQSFLLLLPWNHHQQCWQHPNDLHNPNIVCYSKTPGPSEKEHFRFRIEKGLHCMQGIHRIARRPKNFLAVKNLRAWKICEPAAGTTWKSLEIKMLKWATLRCGRLYQSLSAAGEIIDEKVSNGKSEFNYNEIKWSFSLVRCRKGLDRSWWFWWGVGWGKLRLLLKIFSLQLFIHFLFLSYSVRVIIFTAILLRF